MILRARVVVPVDRPPIPDGGVAVRGDRVEAVGPFSEIRAAFSGDVTDLGERALLPGLINAHCHLDYSMMRGAIQPQKSFTQWVQRINALKRSLTDEDYLAGIARGFLDLKRWGTTTVLNMEAFPELMHRMPPPPIRTWWFYEMIDVRQRIVTDDVLAGANIFFEHHADWPGGFGLSPHAPYTASPDLYRLANACAHGRNMPLATHVAESADEDAMFRRAAGELYDFMGKLGRDMSDCGRGSSLRMLLEQELIGPDWIVAHLNEIDDDDIALLKRRPVHVVHCPRSHQYFRHRPFPLQRLREAGMNVSLGTDSLASNDTLDLFSEMRTLHRREPSLSASDLLHMVTVNPAAALRCGGELGCIRPGSYADLIAVSATSDPSSVYEDIIANTHPISWLMVNGHISGE